MGLASAARSRLPMWRHVAPVIVLIAVLVGGIRCSSPTAPKTPPTILITNAVCRLGPCNALQIRVFVWAFQIPQNPVGMEVLGYARGPTTCLQFPPEWTLSVEGGGSSTKYTWTPNNPAGISLIAQDTVFNSGSGPTPAQTDSSVEDLWPYVASPGILGFSPSFVPGTAPGWSITFPATTASGAAEPGLTAMKTACTP